MSRSVRTGTRRRLSNVECILVDAASKRVTNNVKEDPRVIITASQAIDTAADRKIELFCIRKPNPFMGELAVMFWRLSIRYVIGICGAVLEHMRLIFHRLEGDDNGFVLHVMHIGHDEICCIGEADM